GAPVVAAPCGRGRAGVRTQQRKTTRGAAGRHRGRERRRRGRALPDAQLERDGETQQRLELQYRAAARADQAGATERTRRAEECRVGIDETEIAAPFEAYRDVFAQGEAHAETQRNR